MSAVAAILEGASKGLELLKLAEPFFTSGGKVRMRSILLELGELIADEIERERFGRSSTEPAVGVPPPASTKPEGAES